MKSSKDKIVIAIIIVALITAIGIFAARSSAEQTHQSAAVQQVENDTVNRMVN